MDVGDEEAAERAGLGAPEHGRSGPTVDEAVEKAEANSQVEGVHTPSGQAESGASRVEKMVDVDRTNTTRSVADESSDSDASLPAGPEPGDIGSGGAQRIEGARVSDRVAGGGPVPDGPPFTSEASDADRGQT
jgi:hypothetical protein